MDADRSTPPRTDPAVAVPGVTDPAPNAAPITVDSDGDTTILRVRGDLDAVAAPALRAAFGAVVDQRPVRIRIDMAGVAFLDSVGISALVVAYNQAEESGIELELASVPTSSMRVLEITHLTDVFTIIA